MLKKEQSTNSWIVPIPNFQLQNFEYLYICKCGNHFMLPNLHKELCCDKCLENRIFLPNDFNPDEVGYIEEFHYEVSHSSTNNNDNFKFFFFKPIINNTSNHISFIKEVLLEVSILQNKTFITHSENKKILELVIAKHGNHEKLKDIIYQELYQRLFATKYQQVLDKKDLESGLLDIESLEQYEKLSAYLFLLDYQNINSIDCSFWDKDFIKVTEFDYPFHIAISNILNQKDYYRSIKKTFFNSYLQAMERKKYDPSFDYIVSRVFEDVNLLKELLEVDLGSKAIFCQKKEHIGEYINFLNFLKTFYTQKMICKIIKSSFSQNGMLKDSILMFQTLQKQKDFRFEKQKPNIYFIHNFLVTHTNKQKIFRLKKIVFSYTKKQYEMETNFKDLKFVLPKTNRELFLWGSLLKNCLYSYLNKIISKSIIIVGVFQNDKLLYALELANGKIHQKSGYNNKVVDESDLEVIKEWSGNFLKYSSLSII